MMKQEFERIAGYEVTADDYYSIIEPMYTATNLTKQEFVKVIDKKRFALPTKGEMKKQMRKIAWNIFQNCGSTSFWKEEEELKKIAEEYAKRFYGVESFLEKAYILINRDYAYYGVRQDRGCTFPEEIVIGYDDYEYERIILVA